MPQADRDEALALCDENLMDRMLDAGQLTDADLILAVARRHVFPCWFGSALRRTENDALESVDALLDSTAIPVRLPRWMPLVPKVFKVSQDEQGHAPDMAARDWRRTEGKGPALRRNRW